MSTLALPNLGALLTILPDLVAQHARSTAVYAYLDQVAKATIDELNPDNPEGNDIDLGPLGILNLPFIKMGVINSTHSFGLDELMVYSFYARNSARYKNVADIGGNIGVHSILMARCGWNVTTYEPDPRHLGYLKHNLDCNKITTVTLNEAAVSCKNGKAEFVRVLGNTTSSHLAGAKRNPFGELERFNVRVAAVQEISPHVDFIKVDAEGEEKNIIIGIPAADWAHLDMMAEIGNTENAQAIWPHVQSLGLKVFSQKLNWGLVTSLEGLPTTYKEGSVFITTKPAMLWA
jgi:FkbM family methyltransferase